MRLLFLPAICLVVLTMVMSSCSLDGGAAKWRSDEAMLKPAFSIKLQGPRITVPLPDVALDKAIDDEIEDTNLSRTRFAELFAKALVKIRPGCSLVKCDGDEITLKTADGESEKVFVQNAWVICKDVAGHRKERMRSFLADDFEHIKSVDPVRANVVPVVRSEDLLTEYSKMAKQADLDDIAAGKKPAHISLYHHSIAPGLICVLMEDSPYSMRSISLQDMEKLKIKASDINGELLNNLFKRLPEQIEFQGIDVFSLLAGGDYESSLILSDEVMSSVKKMVKGNLIFSVPNRNTVLFTGDRTPRGIARLREYTEDSFASEPRPICSLLYTWNKGEIKQYK